MPTIKISDQAKADAEELVRAGRFDTIDEAVEAAIRALRNPWYDEQVNLVELAPHVRAAVEEGLADIDAGRVRDADEVFDKLLAELRGRARAA